MIYFDNASTTQISERALNIYNEVSKTCFYNSSSLHKGGVLAKTRLEKARQDILNCINGQVGDRLIFCSGATEANNMALFGLTRKNQSILVSVGEHPSVYNTAMALSQRGNEVDFVKLDSEGTVDFDDFKQKVCSKKYDLVSIMFANNETGAINDIRSLCEIAKQANPKCVFHSDCVQAFGKIDVLVDNLGVDSISLSAHKINGPKGVGALYVKKGVSFNPIVYGGGQESNLRSGTENLPAICAFAEAAIEKCEALKSNFDNVSKIKDTILKKFDDNGFEYEVNGSKTGSPYVLSVSLDGVKGEVLVHKLEMDDIYIGTGSACSSKSSDNRILSAMSKEKGKILGNIRPSFSASNTVAEAEIVAEKIIQYATELRNL